jgi:hypothetical protein
VERRSTWRNHRSAASHWQTLSHNVVSSRPCLSGIRTLQLCVGIMALINVDNIQNDIKRSTAFNYFFSVLILIKFTLIIYLKAFRLNQYRRWDLLVNSCGSYAPWQNVTVSTLLISFGAISKYSDISKWRHIEIATVAITGKLEKNMVTTVGIIHKSNIKFIERDKNW